MNLKMSEIAKVLDAQYIGDNDSVSGFCMDSRAVKEGDCFFAIQGSKFNGENFLGDVFTKGASCAVVSKGCKFEGGNLLKVDDVIKAMGELSSWWRQRCGFKVVAVTGSAGKTTTREMIYHVLSGFYKCHKPVKNFNNDIGLPMTLLDAVEDVEICIAELGANAPGEIGYLSNIAQPDIAVITNTYQAHLEGFGSLENIIREKADISAGLKDGGRLIINEQMGELKKYLQTQSKAFETFEINGVSFNGVVKIGDDEFELEIIGRANLENAAAAWVVVKDFGISAKQFEQRMKSFVGVDMRFEIFESEGITVINDCYNANPASMLAGLEVLVDISQSKCRRAVFVCGDMFELGSESEKLHEELGREIAQSGIEVLLAVGTMVKNTAETAMEMGVECYCFDSAVKLADDIFKYVQDEDVVLIKGSRGVGLEVVTGKFR